LRGILTSGFEPTLPPSPAIGVALGISYPVTAALLSPIPTAFPATTQLSFRDGSVQPPWVGKSRTEEKK